jgi:hypothetical protein
MLKNRSTGEVVMNKHSGIPDRAEGTCRQIMIRIKKVFGKTCCNQKTGDECKKETPPEKAQDKVE